MDPTPAISSGARLRMSTASCAATAGRPSGAGADQVRISDQPRDRTSPRQRSQCSFPVIQEARIHHAARRRGRGLAACGAGGAIPQSGFLFHQSAAARVAVLVNPSNATTAESTSRDVTLRAASPDPQGYRQPRDRCRICCPCARALPTSAWETGRSALG
jgi:hypothetical protein